MTRLAAWCCGVLLTLATGLAQAQLRLLLDDEQADAREDAFHTSTACRPGLSPPQTPMGMAMISAKTMARSAS